MLLSTSALSFLYTSAPVCLDLFPPSLWFLTASRPHLQCLFPLLQVNDCSNLPIGATCTVALHLHDDAGRRFDSNEGVNILYDVDMPQVVRVRLAPGNAELEVTGMSEGRAVIDVIASSHNGAPVTNYLPINVESGLAPGKKKIIRAD